MNFHLAQVNIAKRIAAMDSPVMADFVANLDPINALAEQSDGFVWRLKEDNDNATAITIFDDEFLIVNMSVWESLGALFKYVYQSGHLQMLKRRREWFEKMPQMHMAMWYLPAGYAPTIAEATQRIVHLREHGETPYAFTFKGKFSAPEICIG
ncbi:MAG: DUF3291 domain-containing protein [Gemmatimonadaceae bacterium]|nr:DUF3291 domain-containing protein [Chitinophagaceae bacterium]